MNSGATGQCYMTGRGRRGTCLGVRRGGGRKTYRERGKQNTTRRMTGKRGRGGSLLNEQAVTVLRQKPHAIKEKELMAGKEQSNRQKRRPRRGDKGFGSNKNYLSPRTRGMQRDFVGVFLTRTGKTAGRGSGTQRSIKGNFRVPELKKEGRAGDEIRTRKKKKECSVKAGVEWAERCSGRRY